MYVLLTKFQVKPIFEKGFIQAWLHSCKLLKENGMIDHAELFRADPTTFITQTRWLSPHDYTEIIGNPPPELKPAFDQLTEHINRVVFIQKMEAIKNL
jgi:hypothetical protein